MAIAMAICLVVVPPPGLESLNFLPFKWRIEVGMVLLWFVGWAKTKRFRSPWNAGS